MKGFNPFLRQVAARYYGDGRMEGCCFIFPNRRSMLFFRKYLTEEVRSGGGVPTFMPQMMTENDFFCKVSGMQGSDRITLLIELYECYKTLNPKAESLDEFIFWGDVLLGDFNDVDKYLVDVHQLFANVSDLKAIRDNFSYLTERQREAMERFIGHFIDYSPADDGSEEGVGKDVKRDFLQIWNILEQLYVDFNSRLRAQGQAYEGMIYRSFAKREEPVVDVLAEAFGNGAGEGAEVPTFIFVGLNALNECEKAVMRRMRDAGLAEFCWDYTGTMITDPLNKSSFFMAANVREFPQAYDWEDVGEHRPNVTVINVPSSVGQVKVVPDIITGKEDCAVVLPDDKLLMPLLNTIPPEIKDINVTMGRSLSSSVFHSLMCDISVLQMNMRQSSGKWAFYHRAVRDVFSNGLFVKAAGEVGAETIRKIRKDARIFVTEDRFKDGGLIEKVFRPVVTDPKSTEPEQIRALADHLKAVVEAIVAGLQEGGHPVDEMTLGFAKTWYCEINKLIDRQLAVQPATWLRLMKKLLDPVSVPFKGEPLKGLQIMGPLETRALDFANLVILSANEGTFPSRSVSSSFIPPELRKGFGLPTYEFQDAVWAYYFYRMIARAENVWMIYDSRTEGLHTGEESRYIKQLDMHFGLKPNRLIANVSIGKHAAEGDIPKTEEDIAKIREVTFSATTIRNYLTCPARFYYNKVKKLSSEQDIAESLDQRTIGNVFHATMQSLYYGEEAMRPDFEFPEQKTNFDSKSWDISRDYLLSWQKRSEEIRQRVKALIGKELGVAEVSGRDLVTTEVIVRYVLKAIERDLELLDSKKLDKFVFKGLELPLGAEFAGFRFYGFIDRLDSLGEGTIRVCDYKTGYVSDKDLDINEENAEQRAQEAFEKDSDERPEIAIQVFIYDLLLRGNRHKERISNSIYQTRKLFSEPVREISVSDKFYEAMQEGLEGMLKEITDISVPFTRTDNEKNCKCCDFKMICGR